MKDVAPNAFHCGGNQVRLTVKIIVYGANGYVAGLCNAADADGSPALLLNQLAAGFQDGLFRCDDRIHFFSPPL